MKIMKKLMLLLLVGSMSPQQTNAQKASYVALDIIKVKMGFGKKHYFSLKTTGKCIAKMPSNKTLLAPTSY